MQQKLRPDRKHRIYKARLWRFAGLFSVWVLGFLLFPSMANLSPRDFSVKQPNLAGSIELINPCTEPNEKLVEGLMTIPPRPDDAIGGQEFARLTKNMSGKQRQARARKELQKGNIPEFLRTLKPVHLKTQLSESRQAIATVWVMPDYLAIGSNDDFLRIPLDRETAMQIAHRFGGALPTAKIVDTVARQAQHRLSPRPLPPGPRMRSTAYYLKHNRLIESQRKGTALGVLLDGAKKDLVLTRRLENLQRVAIYGWHRKDGKAIQPLNTWHGAGYTDYSHGVRLVAGQICLNQKPREIYEVLADPVWAPVLNREGAIPKIRTLVMR